MAGGVDDGKISLTITPDDYKNDVYKPGKFLLSLCATVDSSTDDLEPCTNIEVELVDPCDPPETLTRVSLVD